MDELAKRRLSRRIMGKHSPGTAATQFIEYAVEHFSHICPARSTTWLSWWYQRLNNLPFGIVQIAGIWFPFHNPLVYTIIFVSSTFSDTLLRN